MIIADLNHLNAISQAGTAQVEGAGAFSFSAFSAMALGRSSFTGTTLRNRTVSFPYQQSAYSSVSVSSVASGPGAFASASSSSSASVWK